MTKEKQNLSLREKKAAKTKLALVNEFINRLSTTGFGDISIKEVCASVEVSEGTFYNYFPQKVDLIKFYHQLNTIKIIWLVKNKKDSHNILNMFILFFDILAEEMPHENLFFELMSIYTGEKIECEAHEVTLAEKLLAYPDCPGIEAVPVVTFEGFLFDGIQKAISEGVLKTEYSGEDIVVGLMSIILGIPVALENFDAESLKQNYRKHAEIFLKGIQK